MGDYSLFLKVCNITVSRVLCIMVYTWVGGFDKEGKELLAFRTIRFEIYIRLLLKMGYKLIYS